MNLPRIDLNESDILWLKTSIDLFLSNEPYRYQDVLRLLWDNVTEDYEPECIDHLLLYSCYQPTLYGIWHIYPEDAIFQEVDLVVQSITDTLKNNPTTEEVSTEDISTNIDLSKEKVGIIFTLLGSLGTFYRSASSSGSFVGLDHIRFGYNEKEIIQQYRAYRGIENAIKKRIEKDWKSQREYSALEQRHAVNQINELIEEFFENGYVNDTLYQELRSKILESSKFGLNVPEPIQTADTFLDLITSLQEDVSQDSVSSQLTESVTPKKVIDEEAEQSLFSDSINFVTSELSKSDFDSLENQWKKTYTRCAFDPEGAITAAKTLLESTLKTILEELCIEYSDNYDLPKLYNQIKKHLKLDQEDTELKHVKKVLGSCTTLVHFLSEVRNELGDAHGKSHKNVLNPSQDIARLAISVGGHLSIWLIKRYRNICQDST